MQDSLSNSSIASWVRAVCLGFALLVLSSGAAQAQVVTEFSAVALTGAPCGIPSGATSVSVNAAVTQETASGHLTIYPADKTQPLVSNVNFNAGQTRANNAVLSLSSDGTGRVNVVNGSGGTVHVVIDVNGYFQ